MKICESISSISLFVFLTLLLISKPRGIVASITPNPISKTILSPSSPRIKYDVFVSFRGSDNHKNFLSHVLQAFSRKQIVIFSDKNLRGGDEISELHTAIEKSFISLVIFSPNFASSRWCLDELVKIVECRAKYGRIVMPVFYQVDPSDVRHQNGTYRDAFAQHEKKYNQYKVLSWRSALKQSANMSGFDSSHFSKVDDAKLVDEIVQNVLTRLNQVDQGKSKGLVGIEKQISPIESLLHLESEDVRILGIWGMPGIGKTTIAEEVFRRLCSKYESCCFMANVREESERYGTNSLRLRKNLLSTLLEEENLKDDLINGLPPLVKKRLRRMKVLIVLDDVKDAEQLEVLIGKVDWLGPGSRIIITTRDKQVLAGKVDDIYKVEPLDSAESFQLFNMHACNKHEHLEMEYSKLSKKMVDYSKGVPLVLKALANLLCGKDKDIWESQARILKIEQIENVHDVFRLIYTNLDYHEKNIFLDIACFFDGLKLKLDLIKLLLKDRHYSVSTKLDRLKDETLVTISQQSIVSMHDIVQETAWEIVRQESVEEPESRSRLSNPDDIYLVLKDDKVRPSQVWPFQRAWVTFWNCLKLNEASLKAIELNAQINLMKFSHQHISAGEHHDRISNYVYPGSKIPDWLEYKDLFLKIKISDGEAIEVYWDRLQHAIESDHVYLMYGPRGSNYLASRVNDQSKIKIQVRASLRTPTLHYVPFKQQLEFRDGNVVPNNMCPVEEISKFLGI
nr:nodulation protein [Melilotus officinalis]